MSLEERYEVIINDDRIRSQLCCGSDPEHMKSISDRVDILIEAISQCVLDSLREMLNKELNKELNNERNDRDE